MREDWPGMAIHAKAGTEWTAECATCGREFPYGVVMHDAEDCEKRWSERAAGVGGGTAA